MRMRLSGASDRRSGALRAPSQGGVNARLLSRSGAASACPLGPVSAALSSREGRGQTFTRTRCHCGTGVLPLPWAHWATGGQPLVVQVSFPGPISSPVPVCQIGSGASMMVESQMCKHEQNISGISNANPYMGLISCRLELWSGAE